MVVAAHLGEELVVRRLGLLRLHGLAELGLVAFELRVERKLAHCKVVSGMSWEIRKRTAEDVVAELLGALVP